VAHPEFVRKTGQRVHWSSRITIPLTALHYEPDPTIAITTSSSGSADYPTGTLRNPINPAVLANLASLSAADPNYYGAIYSGTYRPVNVMSVGQIAGLGGMRRVEVRKGQAFVDVQWSVTVRTTGTLSAPRVDGFSFGEPTWEVGV